MPNWQSESHAPLLLSESDDGWEKDEAWTVVVGDIIAVNFIQSCDRQAVRPVMSNWQHLDTRQLDRRLSRDGRCQLAVKLLVMRLCKRVCGGVVDWVCMQVNHECETVTVGAGILLTDLNQQLHQHGLALSVLAHSLTQSSHLIWPHFISLECALRWKERKRIAVCATSSARLTGSPHWWPS